MPLSDPRPGLRVVNKRNTVSKIQLVVPAGDELEVSEDVLLQIAAQNQDFVAVGTDEAAKAVPYPPVQDEPEPVKPVKRATKRKS